MSEGKTTMQHTTSFRHRVNAARNAAVLAFGTLAVAGAAMAQNYSPELIENVAPSSKVMSRTFDCWRTVNSVGMIMVNSLLGQALHDGSS